MLASAGVRFTVDSTADARDVRVGDGACRTVAGACTLRAAIQEANALPGADAIELPAGAYAIAIPPQNQNDVASGDLDITDSLTIAGNGAGSTVVDANAIDRVFEVAAAGGTVSLSSLTIRGGEADEYGGAILNSSTATVTVESSAVTGSRAGKTGGGIDNHFGGEVHIRNSTVSDNFATEGGSALNNDRDGQLTITGSTVSSNSAADVGLDETLAGAGAIANNAELDTAGSIEVIGSQISDNRAGGGRSGAAISNDGAGSVVVEDTTFSSNRAHANGGAIYNGSGKVTVADSTFTENAATNGGAVYSSADKDGNVTVSGSTFALNTASGDGGALVGTGTGHLEVVQSTFTKNEADDWGGAVMNANKGSATIQQSSFSENSGLNGGGFANEGAGLVVVESSTFTKNAALPTSLAASGEGGGMHSNSGGEVVVSGGAFTENKAGSGGGLSNEGGGTVSITGTRFATNQADEQGGGLLIEGGAVRMLNIDVVRNVAEGVEEAGGGISYAGDKAVGVGETAALEQSRIVDNKAKGPGGGIDSRGDGPLGITTTAITGNTAGIGGAVHHVGDAPLEVTRSTLSGNVAENGGGVFVDGDGEATVENTTISSNRAGQFGGGLLASSRLTMRNSTVAANDAASGGGINNGGGDLIGDGLVFLGNTVVAGNPTGGNCAGSMTSLGGNVEGANTCQLREFSDQPGTDPLLGPLADNGGPTWTHALGAGSPAQEKAVCTEAVPCPSADQRGVERPRFAEFDAGAYESELSPGEGSGAQRCAGLTERPVVSGFDSWVSQGAPGSNFGNDSILNVASQSGGNERALVHFELPPVPPGCKLISATLRLYSSSAMAGRTLEAVRVAADWSEQSVAWNNQPPTAGPAATTESGLDTREWDVLAQTLEMYASGDYGFLIRDRTENASGDQSFHSGEKGPEHPPELVLVFDDPDPSPRPGSCPTTPQSVSADRDSWVSQDGPTNNFGTDSTLKVKSQAGSNARALVRFGLPILPAGCTGIASATLRLDAASAKEGRALQAVQVSSPWTENGVTWSNQPGVTGPAATTPSASGTLEWEVTDHLLGMYTSGNHGFLIRDAVENGVGDEQALGSRDKIGDGAPQLVLAFDDSTPETAIEAGPDAVSDRADATFSFSSDRSDAKFECSLDGSAFTPCASPHSLEGLAEGDHLLEVRATRRVRAVDPTPASYRWKVAVPPETTIDAGPASPSASADATLRFSSDDPGASFECSLNGAAFGPCTSPVDYVNLADGENEVRVRATDALGNVEPNPAAHRWTVAVPPDTTIDSGPPALGNGTSASFEFGGTDNGPDPQPLAFQCSLDGGVPVACSTGQTYLGLADGVHTFEVTATDRAGNRELEPASRTWTVDTVGPVTKIGAGPAELSNSAATAFQFGADEPARFECKLDAGVWTACVSPHEIGGLADGEHTFEVRATDRAGNQGAAASWTWKVDTVAPDTTIGGGPADPSNSPGATFEFGAGESATFQCQLDSGAWVPCSSPQTYGGLGDGEHTFRVEATDQAGNQEEAPAVYTWTVDTTPPDTTIDSGPADQSNDRAPSFEFSAGEAAGFECRLDAGDWVACTSPYELSGLADREHTFQVQATDKAGNRETAPAVHTWTIDTAAPATSIDAGPPDPSNRAAASLDFSAGEAVTFECRLDRGDWAGCESPHAVSGLADGAHTFEVRATDRAGNQGDPASWVWTVDTVAPVATIDSGPADPSNSGTATFEFGTDEAATFECALDGGEWTACGSPRRYEDLADGEHTFEVRATDRAGNQGGAASRPWTVDTVAPNTTIDGAPSDPSNDRSPSFRFGAGEAATFECKLDSGLFEACSSGQKYAALADGRHTFRVQATDLAGNREAEPTVHSWTIDTVAPETTLTAGPAALSNIAAASFEFGAGEAASFECRLDAGDWAACTSPQAYTALPDGEHTFGVRGTDAAGNQGPAAAWVWTIDTAPPETTIDSGPADPSNSAAASFEFSAREAAAFECKLDTGPFEACSSGQAYPDLADGRHTFEVRATDAAGNRGGTAPRSWRVDTVAPDTTISSGPSDPTNERMATFEFGANEPATFECKLDAGDWAACASGQWYADLADGRHTFQVQATDGAGNDEAEPASYTWTIDPARDATPPDTVLTGQPANPSNNTSATFTFAGTDDATPQTMIAFQCRLDSQAPAAFTSCSSPRLYSGLGQGSHTFEVRAVDVAGNPDPTPATYTWTVDVTTPQTTITAGPAATTSSTGARFVFSGSEQGSTFECSLDGAAFGPCSSPREYTGLADGGHQFSVRAKDAAGNTDATPASFSWTVDTTAPLTTITSAPPATTSSTSASFGFTASEPGSTFECSLDGAPFAACTSPRNYAGLAVGSHQFDVRARDAAGNPDATPAGYQWAISAPPQGCGSPVTASVAADAWIDENSPANNKGTDSILKVQSKGPRDNFRALVRFSLPAVPQGCAVESATLRLYAASARTGRTLEALRLAAAWSENQVSWINQPLPAGAAATAPSGQGYREWSVTAQVQAMYAGVNHGFLIRDSVEGQDAEQQFHSREKDQSPPQLVVRFTAAGG